MNALTSFSHLHPSFIGFERLFDELSTIEKTVRNTYPPYNIIRTKENEFVIEMAVAGFRQEELDITLEKNKLTVSGSKSNDKEHSFESFGFSYIHKGISSKNFSQSFTLLPTIVVKEANCSDGVLSIKLENIVPDEHKPKKIAINNTIEPPQKQMLME